METAEASVLRRATGGRLSLFYDIAVPYKPTRQPTSVDPRPWPCDRSTYMYPEARYPYKDYPNHIRYPSVHLMN